MNPYGLLGLIVILIVVALVVTRLGRHAEGGAADESAWPYRAKRPLLGAAEQQLYTRLSEALPEHLILAQVSLSQVVEIAVASAERTRWLNKVSQKSLDFLVCTPDFAIVAAIELDDATHDRARQERRDADKDQVLEAARIPLVRWRVGKLPDGNEIRLKVLGNSLLSLAPFAAGVST